MAVRKPSYRPSPRVTPETLPRLTAIVEVLAGLKTVSAAARSLSLSRNHFQTILHRGLAALIEAIEVKSGGRPAKPGTVTALEQELRRLKRENAKLKRQTDSTGRLLQVGPPAELLNRPADARVAELFDTPRRQARTLDALLAASGA